MRDIGGKFIKGNTPWSKLNKGKYKLVFSDPIGHGKRISEAKFRANKKYTPEERVKMSLAHGGYKTLDQIGEVSKPKARQPKKVKPNCLVCSKVLSTYKAKYCQKHAPRLFVPKSLKGEKSHNWKGGVTPANIKIRQSKEGIMWRKYIFERDRYTCQKYGTIGWKLVAHHINNFADNPELRFDIDNGITLSLKAHKEFHSIYGNRKNNLKQLLEFLLVK